MIDWTKSMQQSFEYQVINPDTWNPTGMLDHVKGCEVIRDGESETIEYAKIELSDRVGEIYVRPVLVCRQGKEIGKYPLGTFLTQTQPKKHDGKNATFETDCYSALLELKDQLVKIGFYTARGDDIGSECTKIIAGNCRAPVTVAGFVAENDADFISEVDETILSYVSGLLDKASMHLTLDECGRINFSPYRTAEKMQPAWTFDDGNSSILLPDVTDTSDLYGIPNVVEAVYSNGGYNMSVSVENNDLDSPVSIKTRGRRVVKRITDPALSDISAENIEEQLRIFATKELVKASSVEHELTYTHGYCPVRVGDCVRLKYRRAGIDVKAKVVRQSIKCEPGCPVEETAVYSTSLYSGGY